MQSIVIDKPIKILTKEMEMDVKKSNALKLKKMNDGGFHFLSKKNYGSLSMIEKEYYQIRGRLKKQETITELFYEVKGNATYRIISIALPIMMLPTIFMGAVGDDKSNILLGLLLYLMMTGVAIFWALRQEKKLKRMGENNFKTLLEKISL